MWQLPYYRAAALKLEARILANAGPRRGEHLMVDAATGWPQHPLADASAHPGIDVGMHAWILASGGRHAAWLSNYS